MKDEWKALIFNIDRRPKGLKNWFWCCWGIDIWYGNIPVVKILVLINIIVWIIGFII